VWNWGTFDSEAYKIEPLGETSLLTGANASGKTTLIDGLLTLLVPERRMRFYNQTAGSKGERTEDSYVVGEYGENEEGDIKETKKLRADKAKAHSVLLAVFKNEDQFVTLAQARWFSGSELKRTFILCHKALTIAKDFPQFDNNGNWKRALKQTYPKQGSKEIIHFLDSPIEYGRLMRKIFGMRSEKAHTLFSQTIGVKVLGDLNEFVRGQMLEERDSESEFQKIKTYFKTLSDAHKAIEKAYQQIELLQPIRDKSITLSNLKSNLFIFDKHREIAPLWFARHKEILINNFITAKESESDRLQEEKVIYDRNVKDLSDQERELDIQIKNDKVGNQISSLEKRNQDLEDSKSDRIEELKTYNELATSLELQTNTQTKEHFDEQRNLALKQKKEAEIEWDKNDNERIQAATDKQTLSNEFELITNELNLLRSQSNNITGPTARIRNEILSHLGIPEKQLPFIGELIKVRKDGKDWEPAIEKLLNDFAQTLIVPIEFYSMVNKYAHERELNAKILYRKYNRKDIAPVIFSNSAENELINKLEIRDSEFSEFIKQEIERSYKFICTEDLEEFRLADKALMKSGLIKDNSHHERDDRSEVRNRQQYVLGWDTKEKIAALREHAEELNYRIKQTDLKIASLKNQHNRLKTRQDNLNRFIDFRSFKKIDWWSIAGQIEENKRKIEELQKTNDRVNTLKKQRESILKQLEERKKKVEEINDTIRVIDLEVNAQRQKLRQIKDVIDKYTDLEVDDKLNEFQTEFIKDQMFDILSIESAERRTVSKIGETIDNIKNDLRAESSSAESLMRLFINPKKEISDKYDDWNTDTHRLRENAEFIDEYVALLNRIEKQQLAEYKQQFKKYLNEEMITKMSDFQTWLERQEEEIEENIEILNRSLGKINFRQLPPTFISLQSEKDYSPKVKEFKIKLNEWKPNLGEFERTKDDMILEESFNKIKSLLDQLTLDESTRKEVLDVRNWLKFKAVELFKEDPAKPFRSYTGTAKLSGGEGAQLTYTILSSAIAYQFGIHSEGLNTNSFRFICVDEAFSKQDDEKAKFLMELCKQLHLQLMVVSPAKAEEVAIVEPYIARVHFVQRKNNRNSVVFDMPIKQLQEHRQQYLESAG
jgi:uncharacterized protein YPO0396